MLVCKCERCKHCYKSETSKVCPACGEQDFVVELSDVIDLGKETEHELQTR